MRRAWLCFFRGHEGYLALPGEWMVEDFFGKEIVELRFIAA